MYCLVHSFELGLNWGGPSANVLKNWGGGPPPGPYGWYAYVPKDNVLIGQIGLFGLIGTNIHISNFELPL